MKICESQMATICLSSFEYLSERDTKCLLKAWRHKIFRYGMLTFHQYFVRIYVKTDLYPFQKH